MTTKHAEPKHEPKVAVVERSAESHTVTVTSAGFSPAQLAIRPGDTVSWRNDDNTGQHSVKFDRVPDGCATPAASGSMLHGKGCEIQFPQTGVFEYACEHCPNMRGVVNVTAG